MTEKTDQQTAAHYFWGDQCESWILADTPGLSVKQEKMPARTREQLHFHTEAQQFFYMLKGTATFYSDGQTITVGEHQGLLIHPKTPHYIANETAEVLEFLVISQPTTNADRTELDASEEASAAV